MTLSKELFRLRLVDHDEPPTSAEPVPPGQIANIQASFVTPVEQSEELGPQLGIVWGFAYPDENAFERIPEEREELYSLPLPAVEALILQVFLHVAEEASRQENERRKQERAAFAKFLEQALGEAGGLLDRDPPDSRN